MPRSLCRALHAGATRLAEPPTQLGGDQRSALWGVQLAALFFPPCSAQTATLLPPIVSRCAHRERPREERPPPGPPPSRERERDRGLPPPPRADRERPRERCASCWAQRARERPPACGAVSGGEACQAVTMNLVSLQLTWFACAPLQALPCLEAGRSACLVFPHGPLLHHHCHTVHPIPLPASAGPRS